MYKRTITQITDDTLRLCRDFRGTQRNGKTWTWQEVKNQVVRAIRDMVVYTGLLKGIRSILVQEGVYIYDLPPDCIRLLRAAVNGLEGHVIMPKDRAAYDYEASVLPGTPGAPLTFFRHILPPDKIGFVPITGEDGSEFSRDNIYGLLRNITDQTNVLPYDADQALRDIENLEMRMTQAGDGQIIRDLLNPFGNIQVTYIRMPLIPDSPDEYMDSDIPIYVHKDIKYGACLPLLRSQLDQLSTQKRQYFEMKWFSVLSGLQRYAEHKGELDHARPV